MPVAPQKRVLALRADSESGSFWGIIMDDAIANRLAKDLVDAIAAAAAGDPQVEACRERARRLGLDLRVTLETVVSVVSRTNPSDATRIAATPRLVARKWDTDLTAADRRFLRALRIATGRTTSEQV
jgi:hypothetical protein